MRALLSVSALWLNVNAIIRITKRILTRASMICIVNQPLPRGSRSFPQPFSYSNVQQFLILTTHMHSATLAFSCLLLWILDLTPLRKSAHFHQSVQLVIVLFGGTAYLTIHLCSPIFTWCLLCLWSLSSHAHSGSGQKKRVHTLHKRNLTRNAAQFELFVPEHLTHFTSIQSKKNNVGCLCKCVGSVLLPNTVNICCFC